MSTSKVPNPSQHIVAFPAGAEGAGAKILSARDCAIEHRAILRPPYHARPHEFHVPEVRK
jgi:hypothetical protein